MIKKIKWILLFVILGGIIFFISNPFYWGMASSVEKQKELTNEEEYFFYKWSDNCKCKVDRFIVYKDDKKEYFNYSLGFESSNKKILEEDNDYKTAIIILDSILGKQKKYLKQIQIYRVFEQKEGITTRETESSVYTYNADKDSLISGY